MGVRIPQWSPCPLGVIGSRDRLKICFLGVPVRVWQGTPIKAPIAQWLELMAHNRLVLGSNPSGRTNIERKIMAKAAKIKENKIIVEEKEYDLFEIVSEFISVDGKLKAVVRRNKLTSLYEIDFYKDKKVVATESYAFHTLRYHEDAAENYVNGIKKLNEDKVSEV